MTPRALSSRVDDGCAHTCACVRVCMCVCVSGPSTAARSAPRASSSCSRRAASTTTCVSHRPLTRTHYTRTHMSIREPSARVQCKPQTQAFASCDAGLGHVVCVSDRCACVCRCCSRWRRTGASSARAAAQTASTGAGEAALTQTHPTHPPSLPTACTRLVMMHASTHPTHSPSLPTVCSCCGNACIDTPNTHIASLPTICTPCDDACIDSSWER